MLAMDQSVADWAGGVAYPNFNVVLIHITPEDPYPWAQQVIPHELAHLVSEMGYSDCKPERLPLWLVEGLAQYAEGRMSQAERDLVMRALDEEKLPELKTIDRAFPSGDKDAELAYAHSRMVVLYMLDQYGADKMKMLLISLHDGKRIDLALRPLYGLDTSSLDQTWRASEGFGSAPAPDFATPTPAATRTAYATLDLRPSTWNPAASATSTLVPPTATPPATATAAATPTVTPAAQNVKKVVRLGLLLLVCPAVLLGVVGGGAGLVFFLYWLKKKGG